MNCVNTVDRISLLVAVMVSVLQGINLLKDLVREDIQAVIKMGLLITEELNVFDNKGVISSYQSSVLGSGSVKTNRLVMSDAVSEGLDVLKFIVNGPLPQSFSPRGKNLEERLTSQCKRAPGEKMCPKTKSHGRYYAIVGVFTGGIQIRNNLENTLPLRVILKHSSGNQLMAYPVRVRKMDFIMLIDGITQYNLEDIQDAIALLTQFDIVTV